MGLKKRYCDINKVLTTVSQFYEVRKRSPAGLMAPLDRRFWTVLLPHTIYMYSVWTRGSNTATLRPLALLLFVFCCAEWTQSNTEILWISQECGFISGAIKALFISKDVGLCQQQPAVKLKLGAVPAWPLLRAVLLLSSTASGLSLLL